MARDLPNMARAPPIMARAHPNLARALPNMAGRRPLRPRRHPRAWPERRRRDRGSGDDQRAEALLRWRLPPDIRAARGHRRRGARGALREAAEAGAVVRWRCGRREPRGQPAAAHPSGCQGLILPGALLQAQRQGARGERRQLVRHRAAHAT
eukprot:1786706-Prymnesium_polylepis.1